jgi:hypothetical protein
MKHFIVVILIFNIMMSSIVVFADYSYGYTPGPISYIMDGSYCTALSDAQVNGPILIFTGKGTATYDFYLPFNSKDITITYTTKQDTILTLQTETKTYTLSLAAEDKEKVFTFTVPERAGERLFIISADGEIEVSSMVFGKILTVVPVMDIGETNLSPEERAIQTAVILDKNASMIMVNGGRRYIDNNDVKEIPKFIDGSVYLPIHTLARALGYYYEDIPEKGYVLLRKEPYEFCFAPSISYMQYLQEERQEIASPVVYREGETYLPVRYFAEILGKNIGYRDGIIVIDDKFSVETILNDDTIYSYVRDKFIPFYPTESIGNTYYVAQTVNADDSNDGSVERPFKTLKRACEIAQAGDTVMIHEGIYREILRPQNSGTPTNPIIFQAVEGEKVVISANEIVSGFSDYGEKGFLAVQVGWDLGDGRNQVFYDDVCIIEARYPNSPGLFIGENSPKLSNLFPVKGDFKVNDNSPSIVESDTLLNQVVTNYWKDGYFVSMHGYGWALSTAKILQSTKGRLLVGDLCKKWWFDPAKSNNLDFGYITGHINAIDMPGEWVLKNGHLIIYPPEGETAETLQVEMKKRQLVADLTNSAYVQLCGIETIGGGIKMNNSEMCMLNNCNFRYISHYTHGYDQREGFIDDGNIKDENGAPPRGEMGLYIGGKDNVVINSRIDHSAAAGIYGTGVYTYIENNIISNCGYMGSYVSGIHFNTEAWKERSTPRGGYAIYGNTIYNSGRSVLNVSTNEEWIVAPYIPYEVAYNDFHDGILCSLDTGITYEYCTAQGTDKLNSQYHHNYVYYTAESFEQNPYSFGIYHDGGTQYIDTYNNVIFTTQKGTIFTNGGVFIQPNKTAPAVCNAWNNTVLESFVGGKENLSHKEFPSNKPFYAGSTLDMQEHYLLNYNSIGLDYEDTDYHYAKYAKLSGDAYLEYGAVAFSKNNDVITFENISIEHDTIRISIDFRGDYLYTGDLIEVSIGETPQSARARTVTLTSKSPQTYQRNTEIIWVSRVNIGVNNVYLKSINYKSAAIERIKIEGFSEDLDTCIVAKVYGGTFDSILKAGSASMRPTAYYTVPGDKINPMVNNTWPGTKLAYYNVKLQGEADTLVVAAGTGIDYKGQLMYVHINSIDTEPIAVYIVDKDSFIDYTPVEIPLNSTLAAGTYNIYLTFASDAENLSTKHTSNLYYFAFKNSNLAE